MNNKKKNTGASVTSNLEDSPELPQKTLFKRVFGAVSSNDTTMPETLQKNASASISGADLKPVADVGGFKSMTQTGIRSAGFYSTQPF